MTTVPASTAAIEPRWERSRERSFISMTSPRQEAPSEGRARILAKLSALLNLDEDWDESGSPRIDPLAFELATTIAMRVPEEGESLLSIVPVPGGGLQYEWHAADWSFELEILPDRTMEYLLVIREGPTREGMWSEDALEGLFRFIAHLLAVHTPLR